MSTEIYKVQFVPNSNRASTALTLEALVNGSALNVTQILEFKIENGLTIMTNVKMY
jgi:hypothetical protein